jgi:hypothetical protein
MGVMSQQVLQPDMGLQLPAEVRRELIGMGTACNVAAVHLHQALSHSMHVESMIEAQRAQGGAGRVAVQVTEDLQRLADQHFEQAIVVLARASTIYALYASRVALAVSDGEAPPMQGSETIRPSDVITCHGMYLPEVRFCDGGPNDEMQEQNAALARARLVLTDLITHRMQGEAAAGYDEISSVTTETGSDHRLVEFAAALHEYASVLVWALGVASGTQRQDTGNRDRS